MCRPEVEDEEILRISCDRYRPAPPVRTERTPLQRRQEARIHAGIVDRTGGARAAIAGLR